MYKETLSIWLSDDGWLSWDEWDEIMVPLRDWLDTLPPEMRDRLERGSIVTIAPLLAGRWSMSLTEPETMPPDQIDAVVHWSKKRYMPLLVRRGPRNERVLGVGRVRAVPSVH